MPLVIELLDGQRHNRNGFACGDAALDNYLHQLAGQHQRAGIATTHVLVDSASPAQVLGFCSLAAAQVHLSELTAADRKRLPAYPVPAMRMGRLAVASHAQGQGHGQLLLGHAVNLALSVRQTMGVRVLLVDAKDAQVAAFYERYGFRRTASRALTLYLQV